MIKLNSQYSLGELAEKTDTALAYNAEDIGKIVVQNVATIKDAVPGDITFLINSKYSGYLEKSRASAVIIQPEYVNCSIAPCLVTSNPRLALAKLMQLCIPEEAANFNIHANVIIGKDCNISREINIGPNCVIGDRVTINKGACIAAGVVIGNDCIIGDNCQLKANVTLYKCVRIGKNSVIHSGSVIGSDGFGYANDAFGNWVKMPHVGGVLIGDNVEIGSNVSIDRGFMENTEIRNGAIIDNLVQIGHNVIIGEKTAIAGCVAVAGSSEIGASCLIGGGSSIAGHIKIADGVVITGTSAVNRSLLKPGVYSSGFPARENHLWKKNVARFQFLDELAKRVRELERTVKVEEA